MFYLYKFLILNYCKTPHFQDSDSFPILPPAFQQNCFDIIIFMIPWKFRGLNSFIAFCCVLLWFLLRAVLRHSSFLRSAAVQFSAVRSRESFFPGFRTLNSIMIASSCSWSGSMRTSYRPNPLSRFEVMRYFPFLVIFYNKIAPLPAFHLTVRRRAIIKNYL